MTNMSKSMDHSSPAAVMAVKWRAKRDQESKEQNLAVWLQNLEREVNA